MDWLERECRKDEARTGDLVSELMALSVSELAQRVSDEEYLVCHEIGSNAPGSVHEHALQRESVQRAEARGHLSPQAHYRYARFAWALTKALRAIARRSARIAEKEA